MIKKMKTFCIAILLIVMSMLQVKCGAKSKTVETETKKTEILEEESGRKLTSVEINKDTLKEDECFENTGEGEIVIEKPDGTKIKIPNKGAFKRSKNSSHTNTLEKKEDVVVTKKTTKTKLNTTKREKQVQREPFRIPWWVWFLIVAAILIWLEWRRR